MNKTTANKVKCQEENRMRQRDGEWLSEQFKMGRSGKGSEKKIWSWSRCPNEKTDLARWINAREANAELVPRSTSGDRFLCWQWGVLAGPRLLCEGDRMWNPPSLSLLDHRTKPPHATLALWFSFTEDTPCDCKDFDFLDRAVRLFLLGEHWDRAEKSGRKFHPTCL